MKKTVIFGIVTLLVVSIIATGAFAISFGKDKRMHMLDDDSDINKAIEAGDYDAFITAATEADNGRFVGMTESEFSDMVKHHAAMKDNMARMNETRLKIDSAIASGDYDAWKSAITGAPNAEKMLEKVTEDNFDSFVEMHNARVSGDIETAEQIREDLGLENRGMGQGNRDRMMQGQMQDNHQIMDQSGQGNCKFNGERMFQGKGNGRMNE